MAKTAFLLLASLVYLISIFPLRVHYFFSSCLIFFLSRVMGYRRDTVTINIARSFPGFKYDKVEETARTFFRNFSEIVAETLWIISASKKQIKRRIRIINPQLLNEIISSGESVILVSGHVGNWELITRLSLFDSEIPLNIESDRFVVAYKRQHSKLSDKLICWTRNSHNTAKLVESGSLARYMLKNRDTQHCYVLYADQTPLPGSKFVVNFLERETTMINGPEVLSRLTNCQVVYFEMIRERRGVYKIVFSQITRNPSEEPEGAITGKFAELLEKTIREQPDNWLWSHKRWKR